MKDKPKLDVKSIDFMLVDNKLIPAFYEARAHLAEGCSGSCPFEGKVRATMIFNKEQSDKMIKQGNGDYCFKTCLIHDCPAMRFVEENPDYFC
jgi:hypothetical protein